MEDLTSQTKSIEQFLAELHIPDGDCKSYAETLRSNGHDDIQYLQEAIPMVFLESFMREGHASRVIKRLEMFRSQDLPKNSIFHKYGGLQKPLQINMDHATEHEKELLGYEEHGLGHYRAGSFEVSPSGIESAPRSLPSSLMLSRSSPRHTQEALIDIKMIGRGASGTVHKCLYIPTLTFVAVRNFSTT